MKRTVIGAISLLSIFLFSAFTQETSGTAQKKQAAPPPGTQKGVTKGARKKPAGTAAASPTPPDALLAASAPAPIQCPSVDEQSDPPQIAPCVKTSKENGYREIWMNAIVERGDNVTVPILGLRKWLNDKDHKGRDAHALRLYIAGHLLPKDEPSLIEVDQGYINFQLTSLSGFSDTEEKKAWTYIFKEARQRSSQGWASHYSWTSH